MNWKKSILDRKCHKSDIFIKWQRHWKRVKQLGRRKEKRKEIAKLCPPWEENQSGSAWMNIYCKKIIQNIYTFHRFAKKISTQFYQNKFRDVFLASSTHDFHRLKITATIDCICIYLFWQSNASSFRNKENYSNPNFSEFKKK